MKLHLLSIGAGTVASLETLSNTPITNNKEVVSLLSAVIVQVAIMGLAELRKFLNKRKRKKEPETVEEAA